jgi:hypothetical protein
MNMETPRTDKAVKESNGQWSYALVDTCKQLERELAKAINQRDVLRVAINNIEKTALTCGCCGSIEVATKIDKIINNTKETK